MPLIAWPAAGERAVLRHEGHAGRAWGVRGGREHGGGGAAVAKVMGERVIPRKGRGVAAESSEVKGA